MIVIGLIGPIGAGKSVALAEMARLGAVTIRADDVSRELLAPGSALLDAVIEEFGAEFLRPDGTLDRRALGALVFRDADARERLERIVHPAMVARMIELVERLRASAEPPPAVAIEAANLVPMGGLGLVDITVMVTAPRETRVRRLMARDGIVRERAEMMIELHESLGIEDFEADYAISATGSEDDTRRAVERLWRRIVQEDCGAGHSDLASNAGSVSGCQ